VVVEGYLDVIALHQHGFQNAVSPMGTALTEHQLRLVKRRTRRIILALDADAAGEKATLRGLQIARQTLDREQEIIFDSRGWLKQEARLQADIRIATLPEGLDPDDVVNQDPKIWTKILEDASPIVIHVMETLAAHRDLDDPKTKTEIANQILPLIEDVPSSIERETYRQRLARLLRVDERALMESHRSRPVRSRPRPRQHLPLRTTKSSKSVASPFGGAHFLEAYCLGILLRHPNLIYRIDRALQKSGLNRLSSQDFQDASYQALMKLIQISLDQDFSDPLQVLLGSLPVSLMELADSLLARTENLDASEDRILEDLLRAFLDLRRRNVNQSIDHLRFLMEDAQLEGELIVSHYQRTMLQHTHTLGRLDTALQGCNDRSIFFD
jgi:DNA primase